MPPAIAPNEDTTTRDESASDERAIAKLEPIYGREGLACVAASTVVVLGLGGVGSNCVEALARGGVGHLILVDHDVVQQSNINRQAIAFHSTIGRKKTDVIRAMVADINPSARVETHDRFILAADVPDLLLELCANADYVVDAIDTISTKLALAQHAERLGVRLVSSMGAANKLQPTCFRFADLYDTVNCPLCRIMRKEGRKRGIKHLRVLYSCEQPVDVPAREGAARRERSNLGTASFVPPIMGQMIAGDVLCTLAGIGNDTEDTPHENDSPSMEATRAEGTTHSSQLFDLHCHLDFAENPTDAAQALKHHGISALSVTVTPEDYEHTTRLLDGCTNVCVGLGLHPWWVADGRCNDTSIEAFEHLARNAHFIGEIGLDFAKGRKHTHDIQLAAFERAVRACVKDTGNVNENVKNNACKLLSLHAVRAADDVIDVLERFDTTAHHSCVFHWFSGTSDELQRAIKLGCFFSINPRMLQTKRGRAYAQAIPLDRLLLETDQPAAAGEPYDASVQAASLERTMNDLAALRGIDHNELSAYIEQTSKALLRIT